MNEFASSMLRELILNLELFKNKLGFDNKKLSAHLGISHNKLEQIYSYSLDIRISEIVDIAIKINKTPKFFFIDKQN